MSQKCEGIYGLWGWAFVSSPLCQLPMVGGDSSPTSSLVVVFPPLCHTSSYILLVFHHLPMKSLQYWEKSLYSWRSLQRPPCSTLRFITWYILIRTVNSQHLLSDLHNWFLLVYGQFSAEQHVPYIQFLPQISQEGLQCSPSKNQPRAYCPNIYCVYWEFHVSGN